MAYNPNNPNGSATAANSAPVVVASDQVQDIMVTGAASQTALGNNLLLTSAGTAAIDTMAYATGAPSYRSIYAQVIVSGTVSAGVIGFEGSNDNTTFFAIPAAYENNNSAFTTTVTLSSNTNYFLSAKVSYRYFRLRITTAITGGATAQAIYRLSPNEYIPRYIAPTTGTAGNTLVQFANIATAYSAVTTASTNAAAVKTSNGHLYELTVSNTSASAVYVKLYNKASSPTVGTDVPILTVPVAATTTISHNYGALGKRFSTGIAIAATGAIDATDTTNAPAGVQISASYV